MDLQDPGDQFCELLGDLMTSLEDVNEKIIEIGGALPR